jgi:hypothetical protein
LSCKPVREVLVYGNGTAVKFNPEKKRPANRTGKRIYTGEVIASLRLVWAFFWYKCGRQTEFDADSRSPDVAADAVYRRVAGLSHHGGNREKTGNHKSRVHRPVSQEGQGIPQAQRETGNKVAAPAPLASLKSRIPIRTFYINAHSWTFNAFSDIKNNAPFPIREFHSDNGSEFIRRFVPFAYGNDCNAAIRRLRHQSHR